jgi:hypothetical protein
VGQDRSLDGVRDVIEAALAESGIDLSGVRIRAVTRGAGLDLYPDDSGVLRGQVMEAVRRGFAAYRKPTRWHHPHQDEWGARENRATWCWHVGGGPGGCFAHLDRYNPHFFPLGPLRHLLEIAGWRRVDYAQAALARQKGTA